MVWWWIANVVLLVVVAPVVTLLVHRLLRPVREIHGYAHDIREHAGGVLAEVTAVEELRQTRSLVGEAGAGVQGYTEAIAELVSS